MNPADYLLDPKPPTQPDPTNYLRAAIQGKLSDLERDPTEVRSYPKPDEPVWAIRRAVMEELASVSPLRLYQQPKGGHSSSLSGFWESGYLQCLHGAAGTARGITKITRLRACEFEVTLCGHLPISSPEQFYQVLSELGLLSQAIRAICDQTRTEAQDELRSQAKTAISGFLNIRL